MCVTYDTSLMCLAVGWMMELDKYGVVLMSEPAGYLVVVPYVCNSSLQTSFTSSTLEYIQLSNDEC